MELEESGTVVNETVFEIEGMRRRVRRGAQLDRADTSVNQFLRRLLHEQGKAATNLEKHDVPFEEAATAVGDPLSQTIPDPLHSDQEDRFILLGETFRGRLAVVVHVERGSAVRIISARLATTHERRSYEEA